MKHPCEDSGCLLWTEAELGDSPDGILDVIVAEVKLSSCCGEVAFKLGSVAELAHFLDFDEDRVSAPIKQCQCCLLVAALRYTLLPYG